MYSFNEILSGIDSLSTALESNMSTVSSLPALVEEAVSRLITVASVGAAASVITLVLIIGLYFRKH